MAALTMLPENEPKLHLSAPRYGTLIPNRIFVSGLSADTTENDLFVAFSFAKIKSARVIFDRSGTSKGYGFVTFETDEDAKLAQTIGRTIIIKERELCIAPAIKKAYMIKNTTGQFMPTPQLPMSNYQLDYANAAAVPMYPQAVTANNGGMPVFYPHAAAAAAMQYQPFYYNVGMDMPLFMQQYQ